MTASQTLSYALSVAAFTPFLVQSVLAVLMFARKMYRFLPCFFVYTCWVVLITVLRLAMNPSDHLYLPSYSAYFYTYWISEAVCIVLGLMVVAELFDRLFQEYEGLRSLGTVLFRWGMLVMVMVSLASVAVLPNNDAHGIVGTILVMERTARVLQMGLLALLFLFASYFGLRLSDALFGIALGFALFGCTDVILAAMRLHYGYSTANAYSTLRNLSYDCSTFVWAVYLLRHQSAPRRVHDVPANDLRRWNDALLELLHQ